MENNFTDTKYLPKIMNNIWIESHEIKYASFKNPNLGLGWLGTVIPLIFMLTFNGFCNEKANHKSV